ncbi:hypothetical protein [Paraburkholderia agricolaris]|uniref:hypothetical protein n=1 Tax=Paraburkholderia agricolaris TaxID=2152888 RepID=UPI001291B6C8|nr:hypothetical protein [Paraburkholderia agricolaris]
MSAPASETRQDAKARIVAKRKADRENTLAIRVAEAALYASQLNELRDRYCSAFGQCMDRERTAAARNMFVVAGIFERDARHFPRRVTKAIELMKLAVFLLESKVAS